LKARNDDASAIESSMNFVNEQLEVQIVSDNRTFNVKKHVFCFDGRVAVAVV